MLLSEIWVYPVKSLGGIRLQESQVEEKGLKYDRRWMIVDENGRFLTQRVNLKMAMLNVSFHPEGLILSHRSEPESQVLVPFEPAFNEIVQVKVWDDIVTARTVCDKADAWLSEQLEKNVKIVEMTETTKRKMNPADTSHGTLVSFADDFPYLLISEASLQDLNTRLSEPVEMNRFRPNFVVSGTTPFEEDSWKYITIGNMEFEVAKSCERCIVTTIDPGTGIKGREPLKTLFTYRKVDNKAYFGQNLVALQPGIISEGDEIVVLK